ncbi:hypothetical protein L1279_002574 [Planomicrobium sp. HSC-17F08]|nr:hypothetical protein [Planomicrobium sp. HSC-17F08]
MTKVKVSELKKHLKSYSHDDLIRLIVELSKTSKEAQNYLAAKVQRETAAIELYEEAKIQIQQEFFPRKGEPKLRLSHAKKAISNFAKFTDDPFLTTDLMLYYVEIGTEFTVAYGDIDGPFYYSMAKMFNQVTDVCNQSEQLYERFSDRLEAVVLNARGIGWDYPDSLADSYYSIEWLDEEE